MKQGDILIFPTDTVYGLSIYFKLKNFKKYIQKIYEIKKRDENKPISLLVKDKNILKSFVSNYDKNIEKIVDKFMPGPLTIVFDSSDDIKKFTGYKSIGIRIPSSECVKKILNKVNYLFTTSANISNKLDTNNIQDIDEKILEIAKYKYIDDFAGSGLASTVIQYKNKEITLLRQGSISLERILHEYENAK